MNYKVNRSQVTGSIVGYETKRFLNGSTVRINKSGGRVSGAYWSVSHKTISYNIFDRPEFATLREAKAFVESLFEVAA